MRRKKYGYQAAGFLAAFVLWTVLVRFVDVQPIGPRGSVVGFAAFNGWFHNLTGVHMALYVVTDWLGLVPVAVGMGFSVFGLRQWIQRKNISKVDPSILALGGFYLATLGCYLLFEKLVINYRPVLIEGVLEASYPSSTTMLVMCVMPTAQMQLRRRIVSRGLKNVVTVAITAFTLFMVVGRLLSGVHWFTDIAGGTLLSGSLIMLYRYIGDI